MSEEIKTFLEVGFKYIYEKRRTNALQKRKITRPILKIL